MLMLPKIGFILENLDFVFSRHIFGWNKNEKGRGLGGGGGGAFCHKLHFANSYRAKCNM